MKEKKMLCLLVIALVAFAVGLLKDIAGIVFGGGGDAPEHHLDAVERLLKTVPWTADPTRARGAILAFTTADSKPCRSGLSAQQLGEEIRKKGILLYLVCEPSPALQEMCNAAGGMMFPITNDPDPADLLKIGLQMGASIAATVASGGTVPMTAPAAV